MFNNDVELIKILVKVLIFVFDFFIIFWLFLRLWVLDGSLVLLSEFDEKIK